MRALAILPLLFAAPAFAQHEGHQMDQPADPHGGHQMEQPADPHAGHQMPGMEEDQQASDPHAGHQVEQASDPHADHAMPGSASDEPHLPQSGPPPEALSGPAHAADTLFAPDVMAEAREQLRREQGGANFTLVSIDRLEAQIAEGEDGYLWEANAWYGGDIDKLWIKSEGEGEFGGPLDEAEIQTLWSHALDPWFDLQLGVRYDLRPEPDRAHLVAGIQGLAPYFFEVDAAVFLSDEGDLTGRLEAEYDQRITQRLILQPRIEIGLSAQDIPELGIGAGVTGLEAGMRLRYEIVQQFAPYVGVEWQRQFGDTADFTRAAGGDPDRWVFLAGAKFWF